MPNWPRQEELAKVFVKVEQLKKDKSFRAVLQKMHTWKRTEETPHLARAKNLDLVCCSLPEAQALIQGGNLKGLGVMADERIQGFDDVKTFKEQGVDWTLVGWRALGAPSDTPPEVIDTLMKALRDIVASKEFAAFMKTGNYNVSIREGDKARETLDSMDAEMGKLLGMPVLTGFVERVGDPVPLVAADGTRYPAEQLLVAVLDEAAAAAMPAPITPPKCRSWSPRPSSRPCRASPVRSILICRATYSISPSMKTASNGPSPGMCRSGLDRRPMRELSVPWWTCCPRPASP